MAASGRVCTPTLRVRTYRCGRSSHFPAGAAHVTPASRVTYLSVVLFFEILLVAASLAITWFALYALYRLITDES